MRGEGRGGLGVERGITAVRKRCVKRLFSARGLQQGIAVRRERAAIMHSAMRENYSDEGEKRNCLSCPRGHLQHAVLLSI